jgi:hypothetical protein
MGFTWVILDATLCNAGIPEGRLLIGKLLKPYPNAMTGSTMVEILCPHCEEEIGLDDDAVGEFCCPYCDEDFTWDGLLDDGQLADFYDWKGFWISFGIPNLFIICGWILASHLEKYRDDALEWLHLMSFLSWITFLIYGIKEQNKAMWQGALTAIAVAPVVLTLGILYFLVVADWSINLN